MIKEILNELKEIKKVFREPLDMHRKELEKLKREVAVWKRLYNQMGTRNEKLRNQINDLRTRMEESEAYIGALKRFLPWVVKK